jgi:hypothetical protein
MPGGSVGGNPNQGFWNTMQGEIPTQGMSSNYVNPSTMQTIHKLLILAKDTLVFTRTLANKKTFPGNLVPVKIRLLFSFKSTAT